MIPRLTRPSRRHLAHTMHQATRRGLRPYPAATRPSPAEAARARHLAYAKTKRLVDRLIKADLHLLYLSGLRDGKRIANPSWPTPRGTTQGQLVAMHLEAEQ